MNHSTVLLLLAATVFTGCLPRQAQSPAPQSNGKYATAPYDFENPSRKFELPKRLKEISALTVLDRKHVATVQDEKGEIFVLSLKTGEVESRTDFGKNGDYEGIEMVGDRLFVMRSDATIYELTKDGKDDYDSKKLATKLGQRKCNSEGLGTDGKQLLLCCKNADKDDKRNKIYAVNIESGEVSDKPIFKLDPKDAPGKDALRPSALAVHPITGNIVILSSRRHRLLSYSLEGKLIDSWDFSDLNLEQPEGLAFLPNGDMVMSSEGNKKPAVMVYLDWEGS